MPSFMDLPPELRNMIYEHILVQDETISFGNISRLLKPPQISTAFTNHLRKYLPLTQVSQQLRKETTPMLFGRNTFNILLSTHKQKGPLTQLQRQLRSTETPLLFNPITAQRVRGSMTYGDRHAAAWACMRPEAVAHIQRLTIEIQKADLIAGWRRLHHLYWFKSGPEAPGRFPARIWYLHAINTNCPGLHTTTWSVNCKEKTVRCTEMRRIVPPLGSPRPLKSCKTCAQWMQEWANEIVNDQGLSKEHFLKLIWPSGDPNMGYSWT